MPALSEKCPGRPNARAGPLTAQRINRGPQELRNNAGELDIALAEVCKYEDSATCTSCNLTRASRIDNV